MFEITLPKSCTIGHVCFKFSFQSACSPPPNIQVTLLKQNVSGIGHKPPASMPVDSKIDFGMAFQGQLVLIDTYFFFFFVTIPILLYPKRLPA